MGRQGGLGLFAVIGACSALLACNPAVAPASPPSAARAHVAPSTASAGGELFDFPEATSSPQPLASLPGFFLLEPEDGAEVSGHVRKHKPGVRRAK